MSGRYDDILSLPHPTSKKHPRMSAQDRAAQFSPFAALTGYHRVIQEVARQTEARRELGEEEQARLDRKLQFLLDHLAERPEVQICYFQADTRKAGGAYVTVVGAVEKLDRYTRSIHMADGRKISLDDLWEIDGALFSVLS